MVLSRGAQKFERVTVTLVPTSDERGFHSVPSTFSAVRRTYGWRHSASIAYMIVPKKVSNSQVQVELFVNPLKKGKAHSKDLQKVVEDFVQGKIQTEWQGLRLGGISRPTAAVPPSKLIVRGTIEEILGMQIEG